VCVEGERTLRFRLLGAIAAEDADGRPVDLGSRKTRAIMAMLLVQPGRILPADRLIAQLWPAGPPPSATATERAYIAQLRRALETSQTPPAEPHVLRAREPGYLLDVDPRRIDTVRFTDGAAAGRRALAAGDVAGAAALLDAALDEWRGEPLAEFAAEPFARPVVAHLLNVHAEAVQDRAEARLALGDTGWAVTELGRLVRELPYRERLWELLAAALYRAGRQADALAAIREVRDLLDDELGLSPGPGLRAMEQAILHHDLAAIPGRSS
jgi:DNA-binding SARP family transcriptional activator